MGTKKITLGTSEFTIPELAIRQRRVVTPIIVKLAPDLKTLSREKRMHEMSEANLTDMTEVVFQGVQKGLPHLTRDNFLDLVFSIAHLITAYGVVCMQAGFDVESPSTGEANGEAAPAIPPTGNSTSMT